MSGNIRLSVLAMGALASFMGILFFWAVGYPEALTWTVSDRWAAVVAVGHAVATALGTVLFLHTLVGPEPIVIREKRLSLEGKAKALFMSGSLGLIIVAEALVLHSLS